MDEALGGICLELIAAFGSLVDAARDSERLSVLLADLGWSPASPPKPLQDLADIGVPLVGIIGTASDKVDVQAALEAVARLIAAVNLLASRPDGDYPGGIDVPTFKATIGRDLLDYVIVDYLLGKRYWIGGVLKLAGILRLTKLPAAGLRNSYLKKEIVWSRIAEFVLDPPKGFKEVFAWNSAMPLLEEAVGGFVDLVETYGLPLTYFLPETALATFVSAGASGPISNPFAVYASLGEIFDLPLTFAGGLLLLLRPPTASRGAAISLLPYANANVGQDVSLSETTSLSVLGNVDFTKGVAITLAPGMLPEVQYGFLAGTSSVPAEAQFGLKVSPPASQPKLVLIGAKDGSRVEVGGFDVFLGGKAVSGGRLEVFVDLKLSDLGVVVKPASGDADTFLASLLPQDGISADLSFSLRLSSLGGFQFSGSGALEASYPSHFSLGPIDVQAFSVAVKPIQDRLVAQIGATLSGSLGPLIASIDGVGFQLASQFPDPPNGNLGPLEVSFDFKPPAGVGLAIDTGVVQGGGFLYIDTDRGQYAGALELVVADWLTLTAIGLITTKMPDGSKGFSLLVIITADFGPGIQLGFGFTLIGVGGLLGLNRTMLFQPLMDGVRTGAINGILFPTDVIANAPKIISDLQAIFPPKQNTFLIGPMAKLGWGTPPLITLSLGVIIEIPPGDVAILGVLALAIPEEEPVLILQVNFVGALEFSKQRLYFFASMFDSHILTITIDGEMGVLFAYGADANLVLSVGGFHPQFNPPPLPFPTPKRVQLDIINESDARVRCGGYNAATTNTLQFGAFAEYYFGFSAVSVSGHSSFDALLQWSPFHVIVNVTTTFSNVGGVGVFSLDIDVTVEGPTPWHIHGHGSLSFLFFSVSVPIDITFGDARDTSLPPIAVLPIIGGELGKAANWKAVLPTSSNILVSLRKLDPSEAALVLHPVGVLQISQRAIPLDLTIDKIGAQKPTDANRFGLEVTSPGLSKAEDLSESFAPAQFKDFDDAAKLSQPAYTPEHSGIAISAAGISYASGTAITRRMRYDLTVIDTQYRRFQKRFYVFANGLFVHFLGGVRVAFNTFSASTAQQMQPYGQRIAVSGENYAVANQSDNRAYGAGATTFSSRASAQDYLDRSVRGNSALAGKLHVLPQFELTL
jgi:hypothetical protein